MNRIARLLLACTVTTWSIAGFAANEESPDREVLEALYVATCGETWKQNDGWMSDAPIGEWHGVTAGSGRVRELDLSDNNLSGNLPADLKHLTKLRSLDLRWNSLGGPLPDLSNLRSLKSLLLTDNQFSQPIPTWLGNFRRLQRLDLSHNQFRGSIPSEIGKLRRLRSLALHHNDLHGSLPHVVANLTDLRRLILNDNRLSGSIPVDLATLSHLRHLNLSNNGFAGVVPAWISSSKTLEWIDLRGNALESSPDQLRVRMPDYYRTWASSKDGPANQKGVPEHDWSPAQSIVMEMWAQTSEVIEPEEIRAYVFESLKSLKVQDGYVHLSRDQLPEFIRIGNIQGIIATLNSHLRESDNRVATPNELERFFEAVEGDTPGHETVDPFATGKPLERFHEDGVLLDGTHVHTDGLILSGIHAVWEKRRED